MRSIDGGCASLAGHGTAVGQVSYCSSFNLFILIYYSDSQLIAMVHPLYRISHFVIITITVFVHDKNAEVDKDYTCLVQSAVYSSTASQKNYCTTLPQNF